MDNPIVDFTAATVITNAAIINLRKLFSQKDTIRKFEEIERSKVSLDIRSRIIFVFSMITTIVLNRMEINKFVCHINQRRLIYNCSVLVYQWIIVECSNVLSRLNIENDLSGVADVARFSKNILMKTPTFLINSCNLWD